MDPLQSYKQLTVWQRSVDLVEEVYRVSSSLPREEIYGLTNQMRRASVSVPSNIAEGSARDSTKDFIRFISMSYGSLAELETQLIISQRLGYITEEALKPVFSYISEIGKMSNGLVRSLKKKLLLSDHQPLTTDH